MVKMDYTHDPKDLHDVSYPDIYNYIFHEKSGKTLEELKTDKPLEAYDQFVCNWVKDVATSGQQDKS